jgi:putative SOS response-associated peptidase YedK
MAGLEGIDASRMELVDALGVARWEYDEEDHIVKPIVKHADIVPIAVRRAAGADGTGAGERVAVRARFGMPVAGGRLITNARDDRLATSAAWRNLFADVAHRCLTAVSYVVERDGKTGTTFRIQRRDATPMVVPGLCAVRHYTFTSTGNEYDDLGHVQVTTAANDFVATVHDRFVCELDARADRDAWLDAAAKPSDLAALLAAAPDDRYEMVPVASGIWKREADATPTGPPVRWRARQHGLDAFS